MAEKSYLPKTAKLRFIVNWKKMFTLERTFDIIKIDGEVNNSEK